MCTRGKSPVRSTTGAFRAAAAAACALLAAAVGHDARGHGGEEAEGNATRANGRAIAGDAACDVTVEIDEEAERQAGGALYAGPPLPHHPGPGEPLPEMEGAHMLHDPQHGGVFFMAPNKVHHLEAVYSDQCGFRVFLYNAFTRHIHVDRFRAFIRVLPDDPAEPEVIRFMSPAQDGKLLVTEINPPVPRPFEIELYVKFPGSEVPALFNVLVRALEH